MVERRFTITELLEGFASVASLDERVSNLEREVQKLREQLSPRGGGMAPSEKMLYTLKEAAAALSISVSTLEVAMGRGMLRFRRQGRRALIEKREIERFSRADHPRIWPDPVDGKTRRKALTAAKPPEAEERKPSNHAAKALLSDSDVERIRRRFKK